MRNPLLILALSISGLLTLAIDAQQANDSQPPAQKLHHTGHRRHHNPCVAASHLIVKGGGKAVSANKKGGLPKKLFKECMKGYHALKSKDSRSSQTASLTN